MVYVPSRHPHAVGHCNPRNEYVYLTDQLSPPAEVGIQGSCGVKGLVVQGKDLAMLTELLKGLKLAVSPNGPIASDHLIPGQGTQGQAPVLHDIGCGSLRNLRMTSAQQR